MTKEKQRTLADDLLRFMHKPFEDKVVGKKNDFFESIAKARKPQATASHIFTCYYNETTGNSTFIGSFTAEGLGMTFEEFVNACKRRKKLFEAFADRDSLLCTEVTFPSDGTMPKTTNTATITL